MDSWERLWWYNCWVDEINQENERSRMASILTGSFFNPEAAKKMIGKLNPEISLSEEEEERQAKELHEKIVQEEKLKKEPRRRKRRRRIE
jgi:hypothetical protein